MIHRRCCSSVGALIIINQLGGPQADGLLTLLSQAGGPIHQSINHQQRPGHDQHPWASNPGKHPGKFSSGTTPCARLRPWLQGQGRYHSSAHRIHLAHPPTARYLTHSRYHCTSTNTYNYIITWSEAGDLISGRFYLSHKPAHYCADRCSRVIEQHPPRSTNQSITENARPALLSGSSLSSPPPSGSWFLLLVPFFFLLGAPPLQLTPLPLPILLFFSLLVTDYPWN
ncbi:hypothetical protein B0T10DRAFT_45193 [Thelonectria olida]|uniref:Uncharacterized protein n=1 Tax=Thelonectria olida TaxID=1576542 RepID=A0A9P8W5W2_9HYPO|nr:hypothetical protein B0T10DRAFT_45193 [Thelonectria olida]